MRTLPDTNQTAGASQNRATTKVRCQQCGAWKDNKGAWCPNYRSHRSAFKIRQKRFVMPPSQQELRAAARRAVEEVNREIARIESEELNEIRI